jgi:hypothetical protein
VLLTIRKVSAEAGGEAVTGTMMVGGGGVGIQLDHEYQTSSTRQGDIKNISYRTSSPWMLCGQDGI